MQLHMTMKSANVKTGPIPVSTTSADTCPNSCPLKTGGCYAKSGPLGMHWKKVSDGARGINWQEFLAVVKTLPKGQVWRHNQAGDLPGTGDSLDIQALMELVSTSLHTRGFTYTHKPLTPRVIGALKISNASGFTVNVSTQTVSAADSAASHGLPAVVLRPENAINSITPAGNRVVICPAQTKEGVTCASCKLCSIASRKVIIGFRVHGTSKKKAANLIQEVI